MRDALDKKLVAELQQDAWQTYVALGAKIGLSPSAVQRRIERLRREGVVMGATAQVSPDVVGRPLKIFLMLELVSDSKQSLDRLAELLCGFPGFANAYVTIGATDVVVELDCESMQEFQDWSMTALNSEANVKHCTTLVNLKQL